MRIDIHAHYFPVEYLDRLDQYGGPEATAHIRRVKMAAADQSALKIHLEQMEAAKVDMQVLSVSSQLPYFPGEEDSAAAARLANDLYARVVRDQPKRFAAFGCTPLPHVAASVREIGRALDELGMVGITAGTTVRGVSIADRAFDGFFAELNRRKAVLFLHPTGDNAGSRVLEETKLTWPIGAPLEDTVSLLQLMQADVPSRFPDVKIIVPHLGGFAPFLMARLDQLQHRFLPASATRPSVQARYFWYDTVNANPSALRCTWEAAEPDRMLMGSDYPFWRDDAYRLCVDYVGRAGLGPQEVEQVLGGNAQKLLGLERALSA